MDDKERKIAETLAAIAGQGGADPELDKIMLNPVTTSTPERILYSESINHVPEPVE
ncbi:hypothetical protein HY032_02255 [Candidatus Gottesmanbacteria bacterium]|nr:hypothetical protein [Candidatus Gottesmanbacteria bacterium]